jgi:Uma2 family endonuclease
MSAQIEPLLTVNDLDAMPDDSNRYEIIEGELFVSRAPSLDHQRISGNVFAALRTYIDQNPVGEIITTPGVIFSDFNGVIPDLVFISHERRGEIATGDRITGAPDLVIEILSPGAENERRDRTAKRQLYGKYGVREYWIVIPAKREIEVYFLSGHTLKLNARLTEEDDLTSSLLPGLSCKVESIFRI